jgi:hypothetical protein
LRVGRPLLTEGPFDVLNQHCLPDAIVYDELDEIVRAGVKGWDIRVVHSPRIGAVMNSHVDM